MRILINIGYIFRRQENTFIKVLLIKFGLLLKDKSHF